MIIVIMSLNTLINSIQFNSIQSAFYRTADVVAVSPARHIAKRRLELRLEHRLTKHLSMWLLRNSYLWCELVLP